MNDFNVMRNLPNLGVARSNRAGVTNFLTVNRDAYRVGIGFSPR
jgi:hypothetical protein